MLREEGRLGGTPPPPPRLVAWEVTRRCNLACLYCRADAVSQPHPAELTTAEARNLIEQLAHIGRPVLILTGGEPLLRPDILHLVRYGSALGLRVVLATNGTLLDGKWARDLKEAGVRRISISIDAPFARLHDALRCAPGAFEGTLRAMEACRAAGLPFQINTTFTRSNLAHREEMHQFVCRSGAAAWHVFFLVEVGRGRSGGEQLTPGEYEATLSWLAERRAGGKVPIKVTCAPQFVRILRQRSGGGVEGFSSEGSCQLESPTGTGCLAGSAFCFVSHTGRVFPCGYLEVECGDARREGFGRIWKGSEVLVALRDRSNLRGKCGRCEYREVCGGCRARAYAATEDYLAPEPACPYLPATARGGT